MADTVQRPRRPRITLAVLDGIITATSLYLAGPPDCGCESGPEFDEQERLHANVQRAEDWARAMRRWLGGSRG